MLLEEALEEKMLTLLEYEQLSGIKRRLCIMICEGV
jgi:hypothetical protein